MKNFEKFWSMGDHKQHHLVSRKKLYFVFFSPNQPENYSDRYRVRLLSTFKTIKKVSHLCSLNHKQANYIHYYLSHVYPRKVQRPIFESWVRFSEQNLWSSCRLAQKWAERGTKVARWHKSGKIYGFLPLKAAPASPFNRICVRC